MPPPTQVGTAGMSRAEERLPPPLAPYLVGGGGEKRRTTVRPWRPRIALNPVPCLPPSSARAGKKKKGRELSNFHSSTNVTSLGPIGGRKEGKREGGDRGLALRALGLRGTRHWKCFRFADLKDYERLLPSPGEDRGQKGKPRSCPPQ